MAATVCARSDACATPRPPASLLIVAANDRDDFSAQAFDLEATLAAVNQDRFHFDHEPVKH